MNSFHHAFKITHPSHFFFFFADFQTNKTSLILSYNWCHGVLSNAGYWGTSLSEVVGTFLIYENLVFLKNLTILLLLAWVVKIHSTRAIRLQ